MTVLAVESAAAIGSAAILTNGKRLAELTLDNGNTHSETLLPTVHALLRLTGLSLSDIDLFAASVGPGSFTGIRIGVATVKGLAFGKERCCLGISSLEALAYNLCGADALVCPVINARRRQVYTALFRAHNGQVLRLTPDTLLQIDELDTLLAPYDEPVVFVGDACAPARDAVRHPTVTSPLSLCNASAASVGLAALAAYQAGSRGSDRTLSPVYLRPCQAERERLERLQHANELG